MSAPEYDGGGLRTGMASVLACGVAFIAACVGTIVGSAIAWRDMPALPTNAEAAVIVRTAFPDVPTDKPRRKDFIFGNGGSTDASRLGADATPGYVSFTYPSGRDSAWHLTKVLDASERLRKAGWDVDMPRTDRYDLGPEFLATKGDLRLRFSSSAWNSVSKYESEITIVRAAPAWEIPLTIGGAIVGFALGWLGGFRWIHRLFRRPSWLLIGAAAFATAAVAGFLPVWTFGGIGAPGPMITDPALTGLPRPMWSLYYLLDGHLIFAPVAVLGVTGMLIFLLLTQLIRPRPAV